MLLDLSKENKIIGGIAAIWGSITSFILLDAVSTREYIWGGLKSIALAMILLALSLLFKTFYKSVEPRITVFFDSMVGNNKIENGDHKKKKKAA